MMEEKFQSRYYKTEKKKNINVTPEYDKERGQYLIGITWNGYQKVGPLKTIEIQFPRSRIAGKDYFKECKDVSFTKTWCERSFRTSGNCQNGRRPIYTGCCLWILKQYF